MLSVNYLDKAKCFLRFDINKHAIGQTVKESNQQSSLHNTRQMSFSLIHTIQFVVNYLLYHINKLVKSSINRPATTDFRTLHLAQC